MSAALRSPMTASEKAESSEILRSLEFELSQLEEQVKAGKILNFPALDLARSYASNTLVYRQEEKETWNKALAHAGEALSEARPLSLELIQYWNQLLRNEFSGPPLRELDQSLVGRNLLGGAHVGQALEEFDKYVLEVEEEPVLKASRIYQWLISIHPFPNGNGRTARLAADYILLQNGWLPIVFPTPLSSAVALFPDRPNQIRPMESFRQIGRGISRSIEILKLN